MLFFLSSICVDIITARVINLDLCVFSSTMSISDLMEFPAFKKWA